jgi:hypothetical protein
MAFKVHQTLEWLAIQNKLAKHDKTKLTQTLTTAYILCLYVGI